MKAIYLTYNNQSGVVPKLVEIFMDAGIDIDVFNAAENLHYRCKNIKFPKITLFTVINFLISIIKFRTKWRTGYFRTDYAYNTMTRRCISIITKNKYDFIFQSGVLFGLSSADISIPYYLGILDNTYLIGYKGRRWTKGLSLSDRFIQTEKMVYNTATKIFVMSNHVRESLVYDYEVDSDRIVVSGMCPNVISDPSFIPPPTKYNSFRIVMIAKQFERKGGLNVLAVFPEIKKLFPQVKLIILGCSSDKAIDGVEYKGVVGYSAIKNELEKAHIYLMPSKAEPFGLAFLEAMAFYTPCIGTNIEAIPEIIKDGETGYVVPVDNIKILLDRILMLLNNPEMSQRFGHNGYKHYVENFSQDKVSNSLLNNLPK